MRVPRLRQWALIVGVALIVAGVGSWLFSQYQRQQTARESLALIEVLQLDSDSRVADVGAGRGRFTLPIARALTSGYVFATEIDLENLAAIRRAVAAAGVSNVTLLESRDADTGLPPACCDGVFLRHVYHHLTEPEAMAADLYGAVRPGGRLAIIDFGPGGWLSFFAPVAGVPGDRGGHGVPQEIVIDELTGAGFTLERRIDDWSRQSYGLVFVRPDGDGGVTR